MCTHSLYIVVKEIIIKLNLCIVNIYKIINDSLERVRVRA